MEQITPDIFKAIEYDALKRASMEGEGAVKEMYHELAKTASFEETTKVHDLMDKFITVNRIKTSLERAIYGKDIKNKDGSVTKVLPIIVKDSLRADAVILIGELGELEERIRESVIEEKTYDEPAITHFLNPCYEVNF